MDENFKKEYSDYDGISTKAVRKKAEEAKEKAAAAIAASQQK